MAASSCPACSAEIEQVKSKGVTVDRCTGCGGLWFDQGELTLEVEVLRPIELAGGKPSSLACVRCATRPKLVTVTYPGTHTSVEACTVCRGVWLTKEKLQAIHESLRAIVGEPGKSPAGDRTAQILAELQQAPKGPVCPTCKGPFEGITRKGMLLDRCVKCRATWFDAGELTTEIEVSRKISLKEGKPLDLLCPRCPKKTLTLVNYPRTEIPIKICPDCRGAWIGDDQVEALRVAVRGGSGTFPALGG